MCWLSYNNTPIIAKKDVVVYKFLKEKKNFFNIKKYYSPIYGNIKYKKNKLYDLGDLPYKVTGSNDNYVYIRSIGFHSFKDKQCVPSCDILYLNIVLTKCIIPKGATYYVNKEGEVVSNQIIFKEAIK